MTYPFHYIPLQMYSCLQAQASSPTVADVLRLSAFLAPDNIPDAILKLGNDHRGETRDISNGLSSSS